MNPLRLADEGKSHKPPISKMVPDQPADRRVVGTDPRDARGVDQPAKVDHRQTLTTQGAGHAAIVHTGEYAVSLPRFEPGRRRILQPSRRELQQPVLMLAIVMRDPADHLTGIGARRFDQQRHPSLAVSFGS